LQPPPPDVAVEAAAAAPSEASLGTAPVGPDGIANINLNIDNKPISDAVKLVSKVAGLSIVWVATNTTQCVSADVINKPWKPTLQTLLDPCGLQLTERPADSGIYVVVPKSGGEREPWITETFELSYLKSSEAAEMLKSLLGIAVDDKSKARSAAKSARSRAPATSAFEGEPKEEVAVVFREDGRVVSYPAGNTIMVSATALKMEEVRAVLKAIDQPRPQVYIEAKIVEVSGDASKAVGIDWSMLASYSMGVGGAGTKTVNGKTAYDPITSSRTEVETRERGGANYNAGESSAAWDSRGKRVLNDPVTGAIATLDPTTAVASPIDPAGGYSSSISATPGAVAVEGWNEAHGSWRQVTDLNTAVFSADALQIVLSALAQTTDSSVVSNPKIIVANEERAVIDMSRKEPYVVVTQKTEGTGNETTYTYTTEMDVVPGENELLPYIEQAFFTYGIKVEVTPRVNNASNITVTIQPTVSALERYYEPGAGLTRYPIINSKSVRTVFSLGDGSTAVIGGLTQTSDREVVKKVPVLGDIPWLGKYLFSHTTTQKIQTETIIFVTVGIVKADSASQVSVPEGAKLVQNIVSSDGRLIAAEEAKAARADALRAMERAELMTPLGDPAP
jgi:type II secretory pathway component GspD/PulD (secretin)